jgi:hypothetical protein
VDELISFFYLYFNLRHYTTAFSSGDEGGDMGRK